jgi:hypothetical protein
VFWVISVYFNIRNTLPKSGIFLLGHSVYIFGISSIADVKVIPPILGHKSLVCVNGLPLEGEAGIWEGEVL